MDAGRFDRIAVAVGGAAGRRTALRLLTAGVLSTIAGWRGPAARGHQACAAPCAADEDCCNGDCQYLGADGYCGTCATSCLDGQECQHCVTFAPGEPDPFPPCPDAAAAELFRCCPANQYNANGLCCQEADPPAVNCCSVADAEAERCVPACLPLIEIAGEDGDVVWALQYTAHCGRCGLACTGGKQCVAGQCICPDDRNECSDGVCRSCCHDGHCADSHCCDGTCQACCVHGHCEGEQACCNGACRTCTDKETCQPCPSCCNEVCCSQADAICHAATGACCLPDSLAQTCASRCGEVINNCGVNVDCGSCACDPPCPECQICDLAEGLCIPDPEQVEDVCGTEGQVCHSDGSCACNGISCPTCTTCGNSGLCEVCTGCCTNGQCVDSCDDCQTCTNGQCMNCPACCQSGACVADCGNCQTCASGQCVSCSSLGQRCCDGACISGNCCTTSDCPLGSGQVCPSGGGSCHCAEGETECGARCCSGGLQCCENGQCLTCCGGFHLCDDGTCHACCSELHCPGEQICCDASGDGDLTCQQFQEACSIV